jgi:PAS domain-containing protein
VRCTPATGAHFSFAGGPTAQRTTGSRGVVVTLVDVTKRNRAEEVLRESEERFRALVDASAQMV